MFYLPTVKGKIPKLLNPNQFSPWAKQTASKKTKAKDGSQNLSLPHAEKRKRLPDPIIPRHVKRIYRQRE